MNAIEEHNCLISTAWHVPKLRYRLGLELMIQKLILHLYFTKSLKHDTIYKFMDYRRTFLLKILTP